ncbi:hypothetical protein ACVWW7_008343 [Bradyrhizobium sp. LM6.9]
MADSRPFTGAIRGDISGHAKCGAAPRRGAWRGRWCDRGRPSAGHCRRRVRQDQHAGPPRRTSDRRRRRSAPHPLDDVLAPRRGRDGRPGRAHLAKSARREQCRDHARRAHLGRHVSRHRRTVAARICRANRRRSFLHHPRPRGFRRPDEPGPARARIVEDREPLSGQGHVPVDLLALRQCRDGDREGAGPALSLVRRLGGRAEGPVRGLCRGQAGPARARLRRPSCSTGRR